MAKKNKICFFDANMLIWFLQGRAADPVITPEHEVISAEIKDLLADNTALFIAIPALFELLINVTDVKDRDEIMGLLGSAFHLVPFDLQAAMLGSGAYAEKFAELKKVHKGEPNVRNLLKTDVQIMSTALARNADVMYSDDKDIKKMEGHGIVVKRLGDITYQAKLPKVDQNS